MENCRMQKKIYIVGAHSRGQTLAEYMRFLFPGTEIEAFLYDNEEENPQKIGTIPVLKIEKENVFYFDYPVYIGTKGIYHNKLIVRLKEIGFQKICPVTPELDRKLRNAYVRKYYTVSGRNFMKIDELEKQHIHMSGKVKGSIYVVRSIADGTLRCGYTLMPYEKEIQAGSALTDMRLHQDILTDNTGDHISDRNRQYCELTALYWLWKHAKEDFIGLAHYRRHFILPEQWAEIMAIHHIDVILPVPLYVAPDIERNYKKRHIPSKWDAMMQCLKEQDTNMYDMARSFFKGNLYSPCNMFVMRKGVMDAFCSWLFPILEKVTDCDGQKENVYQDRYPGFLSERLLTFYFEQYQGQYNVVYADKNFLT